jgi:hypothetical protein
VSTPDPGDLPIADYDQIPPGELEHRIRSLSRPELEDLLEYEHRHASRVQVLEMLTARLDQLRKGSTPSEGGAAPAAPGSPSRDTRPRTAPRTSPASCATSGPDGFPLRLYGRHPAPEPETTPAPAPALRANFLSYSGSSATGPYESPLRLAGQQKRLRRRLHAPVVRLAPHPRLHGQPCLVQHSGHVVRLPPVEVE